MTFIYAKCKEHIRRPRWDKMLWQAEIEDKPWCLVGDNNVITSTEENLGGIPYNIRKFLDIISIISIIEACGMINQIIWKRLDRGLSCDTLLELIPQTTISYLPSTDSDHYPLLLEIMNKEEGHTRYFKFHTCWVDNPNFLETVKSYWKREVTGIICGESTKNWNTL